MEEIYDLMEMVMRTAWNRKKAMRPTEKRREVMRKERRRSQM
jgi:hypothetical protein